MFSWMYFSPNSVLGRIEAETFRGISLTLSGLRPSTSVAPSPLESTACTWPTMTPRTFTSAFAGSFSPTVSVLQVTLSKEVNFWPKIAVTSQNTSTRKPTKTGAEEAVVHEDA